VSGFARYLRDPGRALRKWRWRRLHRGPRHDVTVDSWNGRLTFDSRDRLIGKYLWVDRAYEPRTIASAMAALEQGGWLRREGRGTLVDAGANIGMITTALLGHGWFERALCVEPSPDNLRLLRLNLAQNGLESRARIAAVALAGAPGELEFELSDTNAGDNRLRASGTGGAPPGAFGEEGRRAIRVPVETLDRLLAAAAIPPSDVRLLWMDIQGFEGKSFAGAAGLLGAGAPVVMEFWPYGLARAGTPRDEFLAIAARHFTRAYHLRDEGPEPIALASLGALWDSLDRPNRMAQILLGGAPQ